MGIDFDEEYRKTNYLLMERISQLRDSGQIVFDGGLESFRDKEVKDAVYSSGDKVAIGLFEKCEEYFRQLDSERIGREISAGMLSKEIDLTEQSLRQTGFNLNLNF